jgi:mRNA-degrading endonuclease toxin of MazEF toxin-antitoxin module
MLLCANLTLCLSHSILEYLAEVIVAPVNSTIRGISSEVLLPKHDGMPNNCAINVPTCRQFHNQELGQ